VVDVRHYGDVAEVVSERGHTPRVAGDPILARGGVGICCLPWVLQALSRGPLRDSARVRLAGGSLFGGLSCRRVLLQPLSRGRLKSSSTACTTPFSRTSSRPTRSPSSRSPHLVVEHLDKLSTVEIVWWSALHPHPAFHVARVLPSAASHVHRVSCEVRGRASATPEQVASRRRFRTPVAFSRVGARRSFDLLQGERAGRDEVRENGVVQAVDELFRRPRD
jgi:hypothetical protein